MDEIQLLIFRWGNEEYGVPVEDVSGITWNTRVERATISGDSFFRDQPIQLVDLGTGFDPGDCKRAVIMNSNGVQFAIVVDEIVKVISQTEAHQPASGTILAPFRVWRFGRRAETGSKAEQIAGTARAGGGTEAAT